MLSTLEVEGLTRRFGSLTALDDLSFSVPSGQIVGFLGSNGAGKTTTMRAIFGLTRLDAGTVRWRGAQVGAAQRRRFGYMPESAACTRRCRSPSRSRTWASCTGCTRPMRRLDLVEHLCDSVVIIDHGRLVVTGRVDDLATGGPHVLRVRVEGDPDGAWARRLTGVVAADFDRGAVRITLDASADSQAVLRAAMAAGPVSEFGVVRRRLSEVFREALG